MNKKIKIGLALGSGGAKGLTHIGVLKALEELEIKIDYICGSSIGALIGASYSAGIPISEIENIALETDWKLMAKLLLPSLSLSSFVNDKYLNDFLKARFHNMTFNDCKIPFSAIATDLETGEMLNINSGKLIDAVRTSISIPMLFSPVQYGEHILADGGLTNPIPVDIVKQQNVDYVIGVNLRNQYSVGQNTINSHLDKPLDRSENETISSDSSVNGVFGNLFRFPKNFLKKEVQKKNNSMPKIVPILNQIFVISQERLSSLIIESSKPDLLIEPDSVEFKTLDFRRSKELIEIGYQATVSKFEESGITQDTIKLKNPATYKKLPDKLET